MKEKEVLEEEEFIRKMDHIIKRDYFPGLLHLEKMRDKLRSRRRELTELIHGGLSAEEENQPASLEEDILTLDMFLAKFTSEDNKSFEELQDMSKEAFQKKFFWLFDCAKPALPISENDKSKSNQKMLELPSYSKPLHNALHFDPKEVEIKPIMDDSGQNLQPKLIKKENTRLPQEFKFQSRKQGEFKAPLPKNDPRRKVDKFIPSTPQLLGLKEKQKEEKYVLGQTGLKREETPEVNGYKYVKKPENVGESVFTWGTIQDTTTLNKREKQKFDIPELSDRESIALKMASDIEKKKSMKRRKHSNLMSESARRLLSSVRRNQASRLLTPRIIKKQ